MKLVDIAGDAGSNGKATGPDGAITPTTARSSAIRIRSSPRGWQNKFTLGRFRLSAMMDACYGNKILNLNNVRLEQGSPATNIIADRYLDAWTPTNTDAEFPRINFTPGTTGSDITSDLLEDGSFLRLRNVTLDVALPDRFLSRYGVSQHAGRTSRDRTWSRGRTTAGSIPDVSSLGIGNVNRGVDVGQYPLAKSVTFGINISY